jgi:hypothetical protein
MVTMAKEWPKTAPPRVHINFGYKERMLFHTHRAVALIRFASTTAGHDDVQACGFCSHGNLETKERSHQLAYHPICADSRIRKSHTSQAASAAKVNLFCAHVFTTRGNSCTCTCMALSEIELIQNIFLDLDSRFSNRCT